MKSILFVDDEPRVLQGLQNLLRRYRRKWDMTFVESGEAALAALREKRFDVIVTDMRMPGMDGAQLLKHVQRDHPHLVRIVLSGHAEMEAALRAIPVSHQFLSKPCEPKAIESAIERACDLKKLIEDDTLARTLGQVDRLPSAPQIYLQVMNAMQREDVTPKEIGAILEQDMAMCAKLLQIVNSSYFRVSRRITRVDEAVNYLGLGTVKSLVLSAEVFGSSTPKVPGFAIEALQSHSLLVGSVASRIVRDGLSREDAFMAGMLHDVGRLVFAQALPDKLGAALASAEAESISVHQAEIQLFGVSHAEVGAYLLGIWGLPYPVVEAVANHHEPGRVQSNDGGLLLAVHLADALVNELVPSGPIHTSPDAAYLDRLGVAEKLPRWRQIATEAVESAVESALPTAAGERP